MLSPQVSVTTPDGASVPASSTRRRGLSYLRELAQGRSRSGSNPDRIRSTPRPHFSRSTSYNETRNPVPEGRRRRSISRPNESTAPLTNEAGDKDRTRRNLSPSPATRRSHSLSGQHLAGQNTDSVANSDNMTRHRTGAKRAISTSDGLNTGTNGDRPTGDTIRRTRDRPSDSVGENETSEKTKLPTIRFLPHQEIRNGRQSLNFTPVTRTLPNENCVIRVGRYSEREGIPLTNPTTPSDAPVGFKSKVVSRKHCEFSFVNGQWHVKDVASSSGTFLNHIRLSQPNTESRLYPIKDGDILQLGIDFRGGEEMIFRCVKIRIECNRSWQKRPNNFNKSRHAQLQNLTKETSANENTGECAICLGPVHPIQALFVAPCAHVWHYKCIRPLLEGKNSTYPAFQCPNCRAYSDLSAEVDIEPEDLDEEMFDAADGQQESQERRGSSGQPDASDEQEPIEDSAPEPAPNAAQSSPSVPSNDNDEEVEQEDGTANRLSTSSSGLLSRRQATNPTSQHINSVNNIDMPERFDLDETTHELEPTVTRTVSPEITQTMSGEGPLTPRNNAGPFVFDGSGGRVPSGRPLTVSAQSENEQ